MMWARRLPLLILLAMALGGGGWMWKDRQARQITFRAGKVLRAHDATYGSEHHPKPLQPPLWEKIKAAVTTRSWAALQPPDPKKALRTVARTPSLALWVAPGNTRNRIFERHPAIREPRIHLRDGQILMGSPGKTDFFSKPLLLSWFALTPVREKTFDVRFKIDGHEHRLRFSNPAYQRRLPVWEAQPLPLTWEANGTSATLHALEHVWNEFDSYKTVQWELRQHWTIRRDGRPADEQFSLESIVEDASGNRCAYGGLLSEPAWKLDCTITRSERYPWPPGEVHWLGAIDRQQLSSLRPGECHMLETNPQVKALGVLFAGVFAPGEYTLDDGVVISRSPPPRDSLKLRLVEANPFRAAVEGATSHVKIFVTRTMFIRQVREAIDPEWKELWRTDTGEPLNLPSHKQELRGHGPEPVMLYRQDLWAARGRTFQYGLVKRGETHQFEFFVKPPPIPQMGAPSSSAAAK